MNTNVELHRGDCLEFLKTLDRRRVDAVVSDPPYGIDLDTDYRRFTAKGVRKSGRKYRRVHGDDRPFDPSPWLDFPKVVLWGANFYPEKLRGAGWLAWVKKPTSCLGKFMGDFEVAWISSRKANYLYHHVWNGAARETERGEHLHPTQKPVALMKFCIEKLNLKPGSTIFDPYMGAGATGVAAVELGHRFIGCEIDPEYFEIAERRIRDAGPGPGDGGAVVIPMKPAPARGMYRKAA